MNKTTREELERVARLYKSNKDASEALGINMRSFSRACRRHGIETPHSRKYGRRPGDRRGKSHS